MALPGVRAYRVEQNHPRRLVVIAGIQRFAQSSPAERVIIRRMRKRTLGKTGLEVSELSLGGLFTSSLGGGVDESRRMLQRAIDLGINYIDTAPRYADSEKTLGEAMVGLESDAPLILSTKVGGRPQPFDPRDRDGLMWSVEESLKLLKRDTIDIMFIHEPDRPRLFNWWTDPFEAYGPVMEVLEELKQDGVIRFTGLGGTTATQLAHLMRSGKFDVVLTAFNYSVIFREAEDDIFPAAAETNMGVVLGSTLQQGGLGRRYDDIVRSKPPWLARPRQQQFLALYDLLDELDMEIVELCLRFALSNPQVHTVLTGPKTAEQIEQACRYVARGPLPPDVMGRLNEINAICPKRPYEEPMILPFREPKYFGPPMANHAELPE